LGGPGFGTNLLDGNVATIDVAGFVEAFLNCGGSVGLGLGQSATYDPDHRQLGCCARAATSRSLQLIGHFINPGLNASLVLFAARRARGAGCTDDLVAHLDRQSPLVGYDVGEMDQAERRIGL